MATAVVVGTQDGPSEDGRPYFIRAESRETYRGDDPKRGHVTIEIGQFCDGRWTYANGYEQRADGFCAGSSPLGYWSDYAPRRLYATRDAAMDAAMAEHRERIAKGPIGASAFQLQLLDRFQPLQPDLFG